MKPYAFTLVLMLAWIGLTNGLKGQVVEATPVAPKMTQVKFKEDKHDFGAIVEGEIVKYRFTFKNTGKEPLQVINVKPSCGCTTPDWTKTPIAPGKKGFVEIQFDSHGKRGIQKKSVTVTFENTDPKNIILSFGADVLAPGESAAEKPQSKPKSKAKL
jgi:Protein of unknown function (DUF1573)